MFKYAGVAIGVIVNGLSIAIWLELAANYPYAAAIRPMGHVFGQFMLLGLALFVGIPLSVGAILDRAVALGVLGILFNLLCFIVGPGVSMIVTESMQFEWLP